MRWRVPVSLERIVGSGISWTLAQAILVASRVEHDRAVHLRHLVEHRRRVVDVELDPAGEAGGRGRSRSPTTIRPPVREWTMLSMPSRRAPPGATMSRALSSRGSWRSETREAHPQDRQTSAFKDGKYRSGMRYGESLVERSGFVCQAELVSEVKAAVVHVVLQLAWRAVRRPPRGRARAARCRGRRPRSARCRAAQSATRTQVEPAIASAKSLPPSMRAWKTAPVAASATVPAITLSIARTPEAIPTFSARHRRHRRGRHRRVDEPEGDPEQQVAGEQQRRRSCRRRSGSGRAGRALRTPSPPSSAGARRSGRSAAPRRAR